MSPFFTLSLSRAAPIYTLAILFMLSFSHAHGQETLTNVISSPPSPVGSGARAAGIGSAFVAVADDATAASWNPAGLVQLERR